MADTDRADMPADDQPGKLPEPKEAGMEQAPEGMEPNAEAGTEEE